MSPEKTLILTRTLLVITALLLAYFSFALYQHKVALALTCESACDKLNYAYGEIGPELACRCGGVKPFNFTMFDVNASNPFTAWAVKGESNRNSNSSV